MSGVLHGKLIGVKINGKYLRCQTDATLSIIVNTTDDSLCKPTEQDSSKSNLWVTHKNNNKQWTVSVTAKSFADELSGAIDNSDIASLMIIGSSSVEMTFQTINTIDYDYLNIFLYEGTGTLTSFTQNAPIDGESTYDLEVTGNGALSYTETPVTPTGGELFVNGILNDSGILNDLQIYNLL